MSELLVFAIEVRFYRSILRISYETGSRLSQLGVLESDATLGSGRPLFRISPESIQNARERINQHRAKIVRSPYNLPTVLCQEKISTATL